MHYVPYIDTSMLAQLAGIGLDDYNATVTGTDQIDYGYQQAMQQYAAMTGSQGAPSTEFWFVVKLPKKNFSESLEMHPDLPMMVPKEGTGELVGVVRDLRELDNLLKETSKEYVHLTYKVKIQGKHAFRTLIEFMAKHDMLDQDGSPAA